MLIAFIIGFLVGVFLFWVWIFNNYFKKELGVLTFKTAISISLLILAGGIAGGFTSELILWMLGIVPSPPNLLDLIFLSFFIFLIIFPFIELYLFSGKLTPYEPQHAIFNKLSSLLIDKLSILGIRNKFLPILSTMILYFLIYLFPGLLLILFGFNFVVSFLIPFLFIPILIFSYYGGKGLYNSFRPLIYFKEFRKDMIISFIGFLTVLYSLSSFFIGLFFPEFLNLIAIPSIISFPFFIYLTVSGFKEDYWDQQPKLELFSYAYSIYGVFSVISLILLEIFDVNGSLLNNELFKNTIILTFLNEGQEYFFNTFGLISDFLVLFVAIYLIFYVKRRYTEGIQNFIIQEIKNGLKNTKFINIKLIHRGSLAWILYKITPIIKNGTLTNFINDKALCNAPLVNNPDSLLELGYKALYSKSDWVAWAGIRILVSHSEWEPKDKRELEYIISILAKGIKSIESIPPHEKNIKGVIGNVRQDALIAFENLSRSVGRKWSLDAFKIICDVFAEEDYLTNEIKMGYGKWEQYDKGYWNGEELPVILEYFAKNLRRNDTIRMIIESIENDNYNNAANSTRNVLIQKLTEYFHLIQLDLAENVRRVLEVGYRDVEKYQLD
ncbi:MAG: hypothetical protein ACTSUX_14795 [Promethearchaeota archaeon]